MPAWTYGLTDQVSLYVAAPEGAESESREAPLHTLLLACERRDLPAVLDRGGERAPLARVLARMMAGFLASQATHLLFVDPAAPFSPAEVFELVAAQRFVAARGLASGPRPGAAAAQPDLLLIGRLAARRICEAYPMTEARARAPGSRELQPHTVAFGPLIDLANHRLLTGLEAFCRRWGDLGGEIWTPAGS